MAQHSSSGAQPIPLLITVLVGLILWFSPHPEGIQIDAWHTFAVFVALIVGIITRPLPVAPIVLSGIVILLLTHTLSIEQAFSAYGKKSIWLIVMSFFLAQGLIKTGLASRIAYYFVRLMGKTPLGLAYGLGAGELCLSMVIPSQVARSGGIMYPIAYAMAKSTEEDHPEQDCSRTCGFLMTSTFHINVVTCAMFLTAMAANPLIAEYAEGYGVEITWALWAKAAIVPGLLSIFLIPQLLMRIFRPELKSTPQAPSLAAKKLADMGPITRHEWILIGTLAVVLQLWIFGKSLGISSAVASMTGLCILLITGVLSWKDCLAVEEAWSTLLWLGGFISLGGSLKELKLFDWLSDTMVEAAGGMAWTWALLALCLFYFYSHYFFASNTAHVSSMYGAFLASAMAVGAPPLLAVMSLAFCSNLFGGLTHYSSGPAPIFYGARYVSLQKWWAIGGALSIFNLALWGSIGLVWWKYLGLY